MTIRTRFAPSPTGPLHLGHAYSALLAERLASESNGLFLLRIEDIDQSRSRIKWEDQIYDDLTWLGLTWPKPVLRQSNRLPRYSQALDQLTRLGLTYPCRCNRTDIEQAAGAPQEGVPQFGPDGRIYPGTCRDRPIHSGTPQDVVRLNMKKSLYLVGKTEFLETGAHFDGLHQLSEQSLIENVGDIILVRRNMGSSYHLSVVVDDFDQEITHVSRGEDLFDATQIHVLLQTLLDLPVPTYHHHRLIRDPAGKRLAKRDDARAIATYRQDGMTVQELRDLISL